MYNSGAKNKNHGHAKDSRQELELKDLKSGLHHFDQYLNLESDTAKPVLDEIITEIEINLVKKYASSISASQLRNIFHKIKSIDDPTDLKLLRPNLAYMAARQQDKNKSKTSIMLFDEMIKKVNDKNTLAGFQRFMEIVVAYHKYYSQEK